VDSADQIEGEGITAKHRLGIECKVHEEVLHLAEEGKKLK